MENNILILGIGNFLMGDEGVGVHLVRALEKEKLPDGVSLLDGGTAGFQLMEYLERFHTVIMIDATLDQHPPGTIRLITPKFSSDFPKAMSSHEIGLKDLVESLSFLERLPRIYLYVVSVADIANLHVGLSEPVNQAMDNLKKQVIALAETLTSEEHFSISK
jgi:hydrogenase maturation protease